MMIEWMNDLLKIIQLEVKQLPYYIACLKV